MVERILGKDEVPSSTLGDGSMKSAEADYIRPGVFQSGQMGQTVNLLSTTSVVRIHLRPRSVMLMGSLRNEPSNIRSLKV